MNKNRKLIEFWTKYRVPFVYDDTLSLYQLVLKVIKHLNLMIGDQNELKKAIKEFLLAFDEDLSDTVELILKEWKDGGSLKEIINEALFESKLDKKIFENYKNQQDKIIEELKTRNYIYRTVKTKDGTIHTFEMLKGTMKLGYKKGGTNIEEVNKRIVFNAGYFDMATRNPDGLVFIDGALVYHGVPRGKQPHLAWNEEKIESVPYNVTADDLSRGGFKNAIQYYKQGIINGQPQTFGGSEKAQRTALGEMNNGNIVICVVNGREENGEKGLKFDDMSKALVENLAIKNLFYLDGGGSTQLKIDGAKPIKPEKPNSYRMVPTFIYFEDLEKDEFSIIPYLIENNNMVFDEIKKIIGKSDSSIVANDLNDLKGTTIAYSYSGTKNKPREFIGFVIQFAEESGNHMVQLAINTVHNSNVMLKKEAETFFIRTKRIIDGENWTEWSPVFYNNIISQMPDLNVSIYNDVGYSGRTAVGNPTPGVWGITETFTARGGDILQRFTGNNGQIHIRRGKNKWDGTATFEDWIKIS